MKTIRVNKVFNLDEDFLFPNCHVCGKELTPFCITRQEIDDKLDWETVEQLIFMKLLLIDEIEKDKSVIYLCKHCLHGEINVDND